MGCAAASLNVVLCYDIIARKQMGGCPPMWIVVCNGGVCGRLAHYPRLDIGVVFLTDGTVADTHQESCVPWIIFLTVVFCEEDDTREVFPKQ